MESFTNIAIVAGYILAWLVGVAVIGCIAYGVVRRAIGVTKLLLQELCRGSFLSAVRQMAGFVAITLGGLGGLVLAISWLTIVSVAGGRFFGQFGYVVPFFGLTVAVGALRSQATAIWLMGWLLVIAVLAGLPVWLHVVDASWRRDWPSLLVVAFGSVIAYGFGRWGCGFWKTPTVRLQP